MTVNVHVFGDVFHNKGAHARVGGLFRVNVADCELGAFRECVGDEGMVLLHADWGDKHLCGAGGREDIIYCLSEMCGEVGSDGGVHDDAFCGHADLAALRSRNQFLGVRVEDEMGDARGRRHLERTGSPLS